MAEILFLSHRVPWPPNRGDKIRSYHMLRKLMEVADVHLACFAESAEEEEQLSPMRTELASYKIVRRTKPTWAAGIESLIKGDPVSLCSFASDEIQDFVDETIAKREIDKTFIFSGQMAQFVPSDFSGTWVMDFADVDSAKFESYAKDGGAPMSWINAREGRLLRAFEEKIARRAEHCVFVSEAEAVLFRERATVASGKIKAIGNGIDLNLYDPTADLGTIDKPGGPLLLFTGQMDYRPNVEAAISFAQEVMPAIRVNHPEVHFAIVGRAPTAEVQRLDGQNGTIVTGAVDDVRPWLKAADVVVAPLRVARGIQNKVLEAMAMGKPVVASAAAAEGIEATDGEHFLVADSVGDEAKLVGDLLSDPARAEEIGAAGRLRMLNAYDWDQQLEQLPGLFGLSCMETAEAAE